MSSNHGGDHLRTRPPGIQGKMPLVNNPVKSQTNNFVRRKFILKPAPIINISNFEN